MVYVILLGDELYPVEPDYTGDSQPETVPQTIAELRSSTLYHHRFEFLGMHNTSIVCTEDQTHGHLSPLVGQAALQSIRDGEVTFSEEQTSSHS